MRKFLTAVLALSTFWIIWVTPVLSQVGPPNTIQCNAFASFTGTAATATVITGSATKTIVICGWHVTSTSATTTTFQFSIGTAANCGSGTNITPALNVTLSAPSADHVDFAVLSYPGPNNVCVNAPASVTGGIWYAQF